MRIDLFLAPLSLLFNYLFVYTGNLLLSTFFFLLTSLKIT